MFALFTNLASNLIADTKFHHMNKIIQFGEYVPGYDVPVLNEREIRAAAGIIFLATFISLMLIVFKGNFVPVKYVVTFFMADLLIRVFINPRFSPALIIGRLIVRNQSPEYVWASPKRFAWIIGILLSATMFVLMVLVNSYSPVSGITCFVCLIFLFFETAFGICVGCKVYSLFNKGKLQYCPGEVCDKKTRQPIQKASRLQVFIMLAFIGSIFITSSLFKAEFNKKPYDLFGIFTKK
jgi:Domain of unknown function (DUF4395)